MGRYGEMCGDVGRYGERALCSRCQLRSTCALPWGRRRVRVRVRGTGRGAQRRRVLSRVTGTGTVGLRDRVRDRVRVRDQVRGTLLLLLLLY